MKFYGQEKIQRELDFMLPHILEGNNLNVMFRAPSGYGKTTLGLICLYYLDREFKNSAYYLPKGDELDNVFNENKRFHFIDEIHILNNPEFLYPLMDSNKYTFFLASNETGILKEPLRNRCVQFIFSNYSEEEMKTIVRDLIRYNLTDDMILLISNRSRNTPRVAKVICIRLNYIFKSYGVPKNVDELDKVLTEILNIQEGGLTEQDLNYLDYLRRVNRASLNTIMSGTRLDRETILTEIEPLLLYQNKIKITSRGRELVNE